jgi:hypothetical protein
VTRTDISCDSVADNTVVTRTDIVTRCDKCLLFVTLTVCHLTELQFSEIWTVLIAVGSKGLRTVYFTLKILKVHSYTLKDYGKTSFAVLFTTYFDFYSAIVKDNIRVHLCELLLVLRLCRTCVNSGRR